MNNNRFLTKSVIEQLLASNEDPFVIRPLLEDSQIGNMSIDFRMGYDFYVSVQGRASFINASANPSQPQSSIPSFFQSTRKRIGETFLLHPGQTVLSSSLEYIKLPQNCFLSLSMRSSYARLGLSLSTIVQPGYCGCISIELTNSSNNIINLTVGARMLQARMYMLDEDSNYFSSRRKYICQVRPELSAVSNDSDLQKLHGIWKSNNNIP
jgi:dCTP deaminase